jgi:uncharacterized protein (TIGR00288 family)
MSENRDLRVALLIDAENIAAKHIDEILDKVSLEGRATVKRIYGDFSANSKSGQAKSWNKIVAEYALSQIQQIQTSTGKNSSDSALIIDAMDLLYSGTIDVMCIVTNDSDFTRLAMRIADSGRIVIGMGTGAQATSKSFMSACSKFYFLENTISSHVEPGEDDNKDIKKTKTSDKSQPEKNAKAHTVPKKVIDTIITAIENADMIGDDWCNIAPIGSVLYRRFPEFDPSIWKRPKQLSLFLKSLGEYFEVEQGEVIGKPAGSYIRIRT